MPLHKILGNNSNTMSVMQKFASEYVENKLNSEFIELDLTRDVGSRS